MSSFSEDTTTFQYIQRLNAIRKEYSKILVDGIQQELYYSYGDSVYAFRRRNEGNGAEIICIFNNSASAQTRQITLNSGLTSYTIGTQLTNLLATNDVFCVEAGEISGSRVIHVTVPANGALLLTSGDPEEYHQPSYEQTKVIVHYDAGFGNSISIRGNTLPLNWEFGQKCENVNTNTWQFVMERPVGGSIEFKVLLNDSTWESGDNHVVKAGSTMEIWPSFD